MIVVCAAESEYTGAPAGSTKELYIIIGNGFDMACGLKTGYKDFLSEVEMAECTHAWLRKKATKKVYETWEKERAEQTETYLSVIDNTWYRYFKKVCKSNSWIDFENEISELLKPIEENKEKNGFGGSSTLQWQCDSDLDKKLNGMLIEYSSRVKWRGIQLRYREYNITYENLRNRLEDDLKEFTNALGHYLKLWQELKKPKPTKSIKEIVDTISQSDTTSIISFNYTHTLEQILSIDHGRDNAEFCYVHGELGSEQPSETIILGMEDFTPAQNPFFYSVRKGHKRRSRKTDSKCNGWAKRLKMPSRTDSSRKLIIFGHSLSAMDRDIIQDFMNVKDMEIVIYYLSDEERDKMMAQLNRYEIERNYIDGIEWIRSEE